MFILVLGLRYVIVCCALSDQKSSLWMFSRHIRGILVNKFKRKYDGDIITYIKGLPCWHFTFGRARQPLHAGTLSTRASDKILWGVKLGWGAKLKKNFIQQFVNIFHSDTSSFLSQLNFVNTGSEKLWGGLFFLLRVKGKAVDEWVQHTIQERYILSDLVRTVYEKYNKGEGINGSMECMSSGQLTGKGFVQWGRTAVTDK